MQFNNLSASPVVGQAVTISVSNSSGTVTWSSDQGSSFNPATSSVSNGSASTSYTPAAAGTDNLTATDDTGDTATSAMPVAAAGGGGGGGGNQSQLGVLATAVAAIYTTDPATFCSSVGTTGSPANTAVHAFKVAAGVNVGTGLYEQSTADAVNSYLAAGSAATAGCAGSAPPPPGPGPITPPPSGGMSKGLKIFLWLLLAAGVAGGIYWAFFTKHGKTTLGMAREKKRKKSKKSKKK
jgi:hypothetical protein